MLSDRGVDENHVPMPSLLAVSAVHQHLVKTKKRTALAIILESGEPREVHHFATLLGYGASAVNPYLALDTIHELIDNGMLEKDYYAAVDDYTHAVTAAGSSRSLPRWAYPRSSPIRARRFLRPSGSPGRSLINILPILSAGWTGSRWRILPEMWMTAIPEAFDPLGLGSDLTLDSVGRHKSRSRERSTGIIRRRFICFRNPQEEAIIRCLKNIHLWWIRRIPVIIRSLMDFRYPEEGVPLEEVESVESIVRRFKTGAMSYGSISQEAHETSGRCHEPHTRQIQHGEGGESA